MGSAPTPMPPPSLSGSPGALDTGYLNRIVRHTHAHNRVVSQWQRAREQRTQAQVQALLHPGTSSRSSSSTPGAIGPDDQSGPFSQPSKQLEREARYAAAVRRRSSHTRRGTTMPSPTARASRQAPKDQENGETDGATVAAPPSHPPISAAEETARDDSTSPFREDARDVVPVPGTHEARPDLESPRTSQSKRKHARRDADRRLAEQEGHPWDRAIKRIRADLSQRPSTLRSHSHRHERGWNHDQSNSQGGSGSHPFSEDKGCDQDERARASQVVPRTSSSEDRTPSSPSIDMSSLAKESQSPPRPRQPHTKSKERKSARSYDRSSHRAHTSSRAHHSHRPDRSPRTQTSRDHSRKHHRDKSHHSSSPRHRHHSHRHRSHRYRRHHDEEPSGT